MLKSTYMAKSYLAKLYTKNFLITLLGLELFFLLIDFLQNQKNIPSSTNLTILYFYYQSFAALKITLALALIFAAIWSFIYLVKSNELTALESIGMSKKEAIKPFFLVSFAAAFLYILLGFTKMGYYYDDARAILQNKQVSQRAQDLFFKYKDEFIYIKSLNPLSKTAEDIQIIGVDGNTVKYSIRAKNALFENDGWVLKDANMIFLDESKEPYLNVLKQDELKTLDGFKPKILDNISQGGEGLNIVDAVNAIWLLKDQKMSLDKIKSALFSAIFLPLFAPFFILILGYFTPVASRGFMQSNFAALWIFAALICWGVLTTLSKLSFYGPIGSYAPMLAIASFGSYGFYLFRRLR
jgi:lipopolysaccharide export system permease protein